MQRLLFVACKEIRDRGLPPPAIEIKVLPRLPLRSISPITPLLFFQLGETRDDVIGLVRDVEKGGIPTLKQLLKVEKYFQYDPLDLEYFSRSHEQALLKANNIQWVIPGFYQRNLYIKGQMLR